jgi:post-segregation antitoxin (ccd killing protein)
MKQRPRSPELAEQEKLWRAENQDAIASINAFIDRHGLLADRLRLRREHDWREENAEAIAQYNRRVAERGLLSDEGGPLTDHEE